MIAFAIGVAFGWLTAAVVVALRDSWQAPGWQDDGPRDADTEESSW